MTRKRTDIKNAKSPQGGFTLLEVLLAVTIFTLVASALYTTFRVGVKAYEAGTQEINRMQHARIIFDTLTRDIRCVYYRPESAYNNTIRQLVSQYEREYQRAEMEGRLEEFLYGEEDDDEEGENEGARNPYNRSIEIDLKFRAEDGEETDSMSFVRYQYDDGTTGIQPWGLGRITYSVEDGALIRAEEDVMTPRKSADGEVLEEKIPGEEVLARGVRRFDLDFGYFFNEDWMEAPDWDSSAKRYRNPANDLIVDEYGEPLIQDDDEYMSTDEYREMMQKEQMKPTDGLPAFVRVTVEIEEREFGPGGPSQGEDSRGEKKASTRVFSSLIRVPAAEENYLPSFFEDEDGELYWDEE